MQFFYDGGDGIAFDDFAKPMVRQLFKARHLTSRSTLVVFSESTKPSYATTQYSDVIIVNLHEITSQQLPMISYTVAVLTTRIYITHLK